MIFNDNKMFVWKIIRSVSLISNIFLSLLLPVIVRSESRHLSSADSLVRFPFYSSFYDPVKVCYHSSPSGKYKEKKNPDRMTMTFADAMKKI